MLTSRRMNVLAQGRDIELFGMLCFDFHDAGTHGFIKSRCWLRYYASLPNLCGNGGERVFV